MTLRELIQSVDSEQYSDSALYKMLRETKPEYSSNRHIQVKLIDGEVAVTNAHVGSLGDILTYPIDVEPELKISKVQLLDAILQELSTNVLELSVTLEEDTISDLCCQFPIPADYDGVGSRGTKFVFYL